MSSLNVYIIDTTMEQDIMVGKYRLINVTDMDIIKNAPKPCLVVMNGQGIPVNLTGIREWLQSMSMADDYLYLKKDSGDFHFKTIRGVVGLTEKELDEVHPLYVEPTYNSEGIDEIEKANYLSDEEIREAKKNIVNTFKYVSINRAQDVFLIEGEYPAVQINGELIKVNELMRWTINEFNVFLSMMLGILNDGGVSRDLYYNRLQDTGGTLDVHADMGENNLRCHLYRSFPKYHGNGVRDFNAVMNIRVIPKKMPILDELNLPEIYEIFEKEHGLLLVSGRGNDGKSTTVASIINEFNNMSDKYRIILTIEEPVEFVHKNKKAWVIHKRVGNGEDAIDFEQATEDAMRENTDIVVIQELRKAEEMHNALRLAEIGKLVISTIHANSVAGTIERFVNEFSGAEKEQIRSRLLDNLLGIIHQNLIVYQGTQLPLVSMLLVTDMETRKALRECKTSYDIERMMENSDSINILTRSDGFDNLVYRDLIPENMKNKYI